MRWRRRRRCLPRPRMLLRTKQRRHSSPRIQGRLRMKGSHSRSGRSHPFPSQLLLSLLLLPFLPQLMFPTRKRKRPRQTNTQRQQKRPIFLSLLLLCPPQIALIFRLKLTQHRLMTIPRRKTLHPSSSLPCIIFIRVRVR